ncbi:MAG: hypothetical protein KDH09_01635 [Chrysiogenetes bacterium]|nr:hypothetical protein [Chrysiogenetes bacterium]
MIQPEDEKVAPLRALEPRRRPGGELARLPGAPSPKPAPTRLNLLSPEQRAMGEASRMLGARLAKHIRGGNTCHVLCDGTQAYPEMLAAIEGAQTRIFFEIYIFRNDRWGTRFFDALLGRARAGVAVYIIYDAFGAGEAEDLFVQLRGAGANVRVYNPFRWSEKFARLNRRNHRKILVVDGQVGFLGGLNVGNEYHDPGTDKPFRDTQLSVRGPMVRQLEDAFIELWEHESGERLRRTRPPRPGAAALRPAPGQGLGLIIAKTPLRGRYLLKAAHHGVLRNAARRIWIANAYFVPTRRIRNALLRAARRGTDVRLLLPGPTDAPLVRWASRAQYTRLLSAGIRIFEYRARMLHSKTILVDEDWLMVGSTNLDHRSFNWNLEVQAVVKDQAAAAELEAAWQADLECAEEILLEEWRGRSWWEKLLNRFAYLMHRWM